MKPTLLLAILLFVGCVPQVSRMESKLIPSGRLHFSQPWGISGISFWPSLDSPKVLDSTMIGRSVTMSPGFQLGELPLKVTFDTLRFYRYTKELDVLGRISDEQTGETWSGIRVLHLRPYKEILTQDGDTFHASLLGVLASDSSGQFSGTFVISKGDLIAFTCLGYMTSFCSVDSILQ